jgi:chromosome segregation ATPase
MAAELSTPGALIAWANSLRQRIDEPFGFGECDEDQLQIPGELRNDLLEALDLLLSEISGGNPNAACMATTYAEAAEDPIAAVLDASLAEWQASVTNGFAQAVVQELDGQLKIAERLNSGLREQEQRLAHRQSECQDLQAQNLRQQAKLIRQRKSVAKSLRARKTQMQLEVEQRLEQALNEARREMKLEIRSELESELESLKQLLRDREQSTSVLEAQLAEARQELSRLPEQMQASNAGWQEVVAKSNDRNEQLQSELRDVEQRLRDERARLRAALQDADQQQQEEIAQLREELQSTLKVLEDERARFRVEVNAAEERLRQGESNRGKENETASELIELREQLELSQIEIEDLSAAKADFDAAKLELKDLRARCAELEEATEAGFEHENVVRSFRQTNAELEEELEALQDELEQAKRALADQSRGQSGDELNSLVEEMERRLSQTQHELEDFRAQNADLAAQLARQQVTGSASKPHVQFDQESLSWEERKAIIMQQLENELNDSGSQDDDSQSTRLEIERVLRSTQLEVEKRDREIEELRSIVQHQSDTKQGVAIGAAAIAQMFDSDELIAQERKKIKAIQQEWEEKLRQAEIDLSMERAKLARERTQLEIQLEDAKSMQASAQIPEPEGKGKTRKWLEHLGLRDENQQDS